MSKKKKAAAAPEPLFYIGPTIQHGRLAKNTTFLTGIPPDMADIVEQIPDIKLLFVPHKQLVSSKKAMLQKGTPEHAVYERLMKGV